MCGIAGIVGPRAADHADRVLRMTNAMGHRGPDGEGLFVSPHGSCVFGHRRLAVLDLSDRAAQPMSADGGRYAFVYNGEAYNFVALRDKLVDDGRPFASSGDSEVVFQHLLAHGAAGLDAINGMFAVALWDDAKGELLLARDRFGQKPLYYVRVGELLLFASEIRALLVSGIVSRSIDLQAVVGYLSFGATPGPATIIRGIRLLPAGSWLRWHAEGEREARYWRPPRDKMTNSPERMRECFFDAVERHLVSDAPVGIFLSGGIDSSAIATAAAQRASGAVRTLCAVFPDQPHQSEASHARLAAAAAGTDHVEIPVSGREMLRLLPAALDAMDQPTVDGVNTFIVSHAARQLGLKVVLSGLGADELFGGYPLFTDLPRLFRLRRALGPLAAPIALVLLKAQRWSRHAPKLADVLAAPPRLVDAYLSRRKLISSWQLATIVPGLVERGWIGGIASVRHEELALLGQERALPDIIALLELDAYLAQTLLRDSDVMGMSHGLEIRAPFLDADFSQLALQLDPVVRRPAGTPKWWFKRAMEAHLPRENLLRPKQGFALPLGDWMQHELRAEVSDGIEALAAYAFVDGAAVRGIWRAFLDEPARVGWSRPWLLFVLGRYLRSHGVAA